MACDNTSEPKRICIIGAGPTGLSTAKLIKDQDPKARITILEKNSFVGGIARTETNGRISYDIGPHYYYSSNEDVLRFFFSVLPQDDFLSHRKVALINTMGRYFDYPIKINNRSIKSLGMKLFPIMVSWIAKSFYRRRNNLEDYFIANYGRELYQIFFEKYTAKVWGIHPSKLPFDFLGQRNERDGILDILKNTFCAEKNDVELKMENAQKFFLNNFLYPPLGSGRFWEILSDDLDVDIRYDALIDEIDTDSKSVFYFKEGQREPLSYDYIVCTNPVIETLRYTHADEKSLSLAARALRFRGLITVNLELDSITIGEGDNRRAHYVYMHEEEEITGRVTIFSNWSEKMAAEGRVSCCLEYYCDPCDNWFQLSDEELVRMAKEDLLRAGYMGKGDPIHSYGVVRVENGYPVTTDKAIRSKILDEIRKNGIYSIGRLGSHEYISAGKCVEQALAISRMIRLNGLENG